MDFSLLENGIWNTALIGVSNTSNFVKSTIEELKQIEQCSDEELNKTALKYLFLHTDKEQDLNFVDKDFEAWINGPVVVSLFHALQGYYYCPKNIPDADSGHLTEEQKETILAVLKYYGDLTSSELVQLTHKEDPWKNTRKNLSSTTPSKKIIKKQDIADYYISIYDKENEKSS